MVIHRQPMRARALDDSSHESFPFRHVFKNFEMGATKVPFEVEKFLVTDRAQI